MEPLRRVQLEYFKLSKDLEGQTLAAFFSYYLIVRVVLPTAFEFSNIGSSPLSGSAAVAPAAEASPFANSATASVPPVPAAVSILPALPAPPPIAVRSPNPSPSIDPAPPVVPAQTWQRDVKPDPAAAERIRASRGGTVPTGELKSKAGRSTRFRQQMVSADKHNCNVFLHLFTALIIVSRNI